MPSLSERLRHGLASAILSAAAIGVAGDTGAVDLTAQASQQVADSTKPAGVAKPAVRGKPAAPAVKKPASTKAAPSSGCGAAEGGCGASR